jgi:hypothetical protein
MLSEGRGRGTNRAPALESEQIRGYGRQCIEGSQAVRFGVTFEQFARLVCNVRIEFCT